MRLSPHALARNCIVLAAAVLTVVPGGAATAATPITPKTTRPHVVGGFLPSPARVVPKTAHGGARASEVLPASVDLRQYAPSPGNQGQVGSCVAWTIGYGIMGYYANRTGGVGAPYAPLFLYLRNVAPGGAPNAGLYPDQVLANAQSAGVDTQADYWQGTTDYRTPPTAAQIANATNYRITGWTRLFNGAGQGDPVKTSIKQALAAGNPVALGIPVYQDFMYLRGHALYNTLTGSSLGGHMISAFGYDDTGVVIRNSWGTGWGNGGDAKLSWAFITRAAMSAYSVSGIRTPAVTPTPAPQPPTVTALSGVKGAAGGTVTITGTALAGATAVRFGDTPASFTAAGATTLVAKVPARPVGIVDVTVTTPAGRSVPGPVTRFTYLPPVPAISSVVPASGFVNATTYAVVSGTALLTTTSVSAGDRPVAFTRVNDTTLRVTLPPRVAGEVALSVTTAGGVSPVTAAGRFTYRALPVPAVAVVAPSSGSGKVAATVQLTGTGLLTASKVTANGVPLSFSVVGDQRLQLTLPPRPAGAVALVVTTAGGVSAPATYLVSQPMAKARRVGTPLPVLFTSARS